MSFETQVAELNMSDLDKLFETTPTTTPTADNLIVGKQNDNSNEEVAIIANTDNEIPFLEDIDTLEAVVDGEEAKIEDAKDAKAKTSTKEDAATEAVEDKEKLETAKAEDLKQVSAVLKNTVDYLVDTGLWADFDGRDTLEMTQEVYADLAAKQNQHTALEIVNELIDSTGSYGKAIISHIKSGGNPDEIIDLFKEQKAIEQIDTSTEEGKQLKIEKYYKDILGWKAEKVNKVVKRLVEENEIDSEFKDVDELYNQHYEKKLAETQAEVTRQQEENNKRQATFVTNIKSVLDQDTALTEKDKKVIASSILEFKHKLDNGQKVNDFYLKFAEMQADPKKYVKLVRFVMDTENYEKQIQSTEKTKAAKEVFNFIKGNATISKTKNSDIQIDEKVSTTAKRGTDFSFLINKK